MRRVIENLASMFWFLMDIFWSCDLDVLAVIMIIPTVYANMLMFKHADYKISKVLVAIATNSWVLMNVCWMMPDVFDGNWTSYMFGCRWIFLCIASLSMLLIMLTDFNSLRNIKRFR